MFRVIIATISKLIFEYDNIILGSSFEALLLGCQKFCPVIFSDFEKPFRFDYLKPEIDLQCLKLPQEFEQKSLTTFSGQKRVGCPKEILWERMMFLLSTRGQVPLSNLCTNMRASDNSIICYNDYAKIAEIRFNNCYYLGDNNIQGLFYQTELEKNTYICYDWIAFNKGGKHDIDFIQTDDDFVKRVWFYPSDRIDGNTGVKDACVVSLLTEQQVHDFQYSETMARFKLISIMEKNGMKGLFNGYDQNGNPKYYKFKTSHITREKYAKRNTPTFKVEGFENFKYSKQDRDQVLQSLCLGTDLLLKGSNV